MTFPPLTNPINALKIHCFKGFLLEINAIPKKMVTSGAETFSFFAPSQPISPSCNPDFHLTFLPFYFFSCIYSLVAWHIPCRLIIINKNHRPSVSNNNINDNNKSILLQPLQITCIIRQYDTYCIQLAKRPSVLGENVIIYPKLSIYLVECND